ERSGRELSRFRRLAETEPQFLRYGVFQSSLEREPGVARRNDRDAQDDVYDRESFLVTRRAANARPRPHAGGRRTESGEGDADQRTALEENLRRRSETDRPRCPARRHAAYRCRRYAGRFSFSNADRHL